MSLWEPAFRVLLVRGNLYSPQSRDASCRRSGTRLNTIPSARRSCKALWREGGNVADKERAGSTILKSGRPWACQNYSSKQQTEQVGDAHPSLHQQSPPNDETSSREYSFISYINRMIFLQQITTPWFFLVRVKQYIVRLSLSLTVFFNVVVHIS